MQATWSHFFPFISGLVYSSSSSRPQVLPSIFPSGPAYPCSSTLERIEKIQSGHERPFDLMVPAVPAAESSPSLPSVQLLPSKQESQSCSQHSPVPVSQGCEKAATHRDPTPSSLPRSRTELLGRGTWALCDICYDTYTQGRVSHSPCKSPRFSLLFLAHQGSSLTPGQDGTFLVRDL